MGELNHLLDIRQHAPKQCLPNFASHSIHTAAPSADLLSFQASYVAPEDGEQQNSVDTLVAAAVLLAPLVLVGVKIGGRLLAK